MGESAFFLKARGLTFGFGEGPVLEALDLEVPRGARWALSGPNGSGKTTFLRLAAGLLLPEGGSLEVMGGNPQDGRVRSEVGYLGAGDGFYPAMTGRENLHFAQSLHGHPDHEDAQRHLEGLGLAEAADRSVGAYSTGMRRRLALARLALGHHQVLLLDEPFRGLDTGGQTWLDHWLDARHQAGKGWILVTHDPQKRRRHAERVARLEGRRVVCVERTAGG